MTTVKGLPGQTIFDVALQQYGDVAGLRYLLEDNNINGELVVVPQTITGQTLVVRNAIINKKVTDYYQSPVVTY